MNLDIRMKRAALEAGLSCLLRNKGRSSERTARNILDLGSSITHTKINEKNRPLQYQILIDLLSGADNDTIKAFIYELFSLI